MSANELEKTRLNPGTRKQSVAPQQSTVASRERYFGEAPNAGQSSRLPGFYALPISERLKLAGEFSGLDHSTMSSLAQFGALSAELTDVFIENAVGVMSLPLGIATNFRIDGRDVLVPMAVEETSVLAAASHGAKLARAGGGFVTDVDDPIMTGQIQLLVDPPGGDASGFDELLLRHTDELLAYANRGHERLLERGGGAKSLTWRYIPEISSLVIHLHIHVGDAMGANIVNTMCEKLSAILPGILGKAAVGVGLRILTNLTDRRCARVSCRVPHTALHTPEFDGKDLVDRIVMAYQFAAADVYRATTNNKGVMNGIDPVVIATGNDWRAIEAGAHAYACRSGRYQPLAVWQRDNDYTLHGYLEIPMAVGVVGGVTKLHPTAQAALQIMGRPTAKELAGIITAVGLAQNLSALRALASEGIQRGHMSLHQSNLDLLRRHDPQRPREN